jgi:UDP-N-acetylmuramoyl-tripeptide--D-alanyl-D-alanine ligase
VPLTIEAPSTLAALHTLAAAWRQQLSTEVVGVTGSIGKTGTRDVVATVLSERYRVAKSEGNYNNEIGLPLTFLSLDSSHDYAVLEMGMYALGEIRQLCALSQPRVGVVTNIGPTHLERLGSIEHIAEAKSELVDALPADGLAVLNGDDERVRAMAGRASCRVLTYGFGDASDIHGSHLVSRGLEGIELDIMAGGVTIRARLPMPGEQSAYAALAGAAVGLDCGLTLEQVTSGLARTTECSRLKSLRCDGLLVLDDSYNAAPASVAAALALLGELPGRRLAVLGDMLELGSYSEAGHREVGRRVPSVADVLLVVGERGRLVAEEALAAGMPAESVHTCADSGEAASLLRRLAHEGDTILVKGSRAMRLDELVQALARGQA